MADGSPQIRSRGSTEMIATCRLPRVLPEELATTLKSVPWVHAASCVRLHVFGEEVQDWKGNLQQHHATHRPLATQEPESAVAIPCPDSLSARRRYSGKHCQSCGCNHFCPLKWVLSSLQPPSNMHRKLDKVHGVRPSAIRPARLATHILDEHSL